MDTEIKATLFEAQRLVLEEYSRGAPLGRVLEVLCAQVEELLESSVRCSIVLREGGQLRHGAAPSLPKSYTEAIDGLAIGPKAGSCGTALYRGEPVIVTDIATDPLWEDYRDIAELYDLGACWSLPIFDRKRRPIASFAAYAREPRTPTELELGYLNGSADLTGLVIARARMERNLVDERARLSVILDGTDIGLWQWDLSSRSYSLNDKGCELLGYALGDLSHVSQDMLTEIIHPDDFGPGLAVMRQHIHGERDYFEAELRMRRGDDGGWRWIHGRGRVIEMEGRRPARIMGTLRDIHAQKEREEALARNERLLERTGRLAKIGGFEYRSSSEHLWLSDEARRLYGFPPDVELTRADVWPLHVEGEHRDRLRAAIQRAIDEGVPYEEETPVVNLRGETIWLRSVGVPIPQQDGSVCIEGALQDVTRRRKSEEELQRMRKLESLGRLAGGIAHDFNNILLSFFGNVALARDLIDEEHPAQEDLEQAERALERARSLTHKLLTFARGGEPAVTPRALAGPIRARVQRELEGSDVEVRFDFAEDLWPANVDLEQILQVTSNLTLNAREAMEHAGTLTVSLDNQDVSPSEVFSASGPHVRLVIQDDGPGIAPEDMSKIFDPYFSTREDGRGLGLATVHSIVSRHKGHISFESNEEEGLRATLLLPASPPRDERAPDKNQRVESTTPSDADARLRVLLMDDEQGILRVTSRMLSRLNHEVTCARDGEEALALFEEALDEGDTFDLVIMDMTIPGGLGGIPTMERLLEFDPEVRVIASTGYTDHPVVANFRDYGFAAVLPKPYTSRALAEAVSSAVTTARD